MLNGEGKRFAFRIDEKKRDRWERIQNRELIFMCHRGIILLTANGVNWRRHMCITYQKATANDIDSIYQLCTRLIKDYEQLELIDYRKVLEWVREKIEKSIEEYTVIFVNEQKAGYYHFYKNDSGKFEIDDLYIFPKFQNQGIGSTVVRNCCQSVNEPVMLYVFSANKGAVSLYQRLGFEISETIHGTRYIMRNENRKCYIAYGDR